MDDSCAVCAESLEWVAYGPCGHREVCSTCIARLRFICDDRRCCLCKAESQIVFVTKALGDYTRTVTDFSVFPSDSVEGKVGTYWFHEDTQAYFDDSDHYKMIKAMCRLSCSVCDNMEDQGNDGSKKRGNFSNIEQLKSHLYHRHRLFMCSLCLEGRKIFICEQKLYTRSQLNQHINTGDSEVDGSESERGGFTGHPMCEFCRHPFYGDNELYSHMSTEHFTCHICQRQHQGQYDYFKNYDDLEIHFRREHFLCEDEACLAKKFIVFPSESEMKRHNALEHGGNISRSKRNAVLQIPTSFQYRRRTEQDHRRGRGRGFLRGSSDSQLALAIQDSFEMANTDNTSHGPSSSTQVSGHGEISDLDLVMRPSESLATADSEHSLRYHQALGQSSRNAPLEESFFPPLPKAPGSSQRKHKHEGVTKNTMAARLRHRSNRTVNVHNSPQAWPATRPSSSSSTSSRPATIGLGSPSSSASSTQSKPVMTNGHLPSSYASFAQARPATVKGLASASSSSPSWNSSIAGRVSYSASAPKLADIGSLDSSMSSFPPISAAQNHNLQTSSPSIPGGKDVHTANKSLVERIRAALEFDENKFTAFKDISAEFRKGLIDSVEYLSYAQQFGLLHLVPELAKLCPDAWKQKELVETYNTNLRICVLENGQGNSHGHSKHNNGANKGKGKRVDDANSNQKEMLADSFVSAVKKLHLSYKPSEEEVEVLAKDGYRASKGKSKVLVVDDQTELSAARRQLAELEGQNDPQSAGGASSIKILGVGAGGSKPRKKTSKFHRVRLGDASAAARLDLQHSERSPEQVEEMGDENRRPSKGLPVPGVWQNGGGHRLLRQ